MDRQSVRDLPPPDFWNDERWRRCSEQDGHYHFDGEKNAMTVSRKRLPYKKGRCWVGAVFHFSREVVYYPKDEAADQSHTTRVVGREVSFFEHGSHVRFWGLADSGEYEMFAVFSRGRWHSFQSALYGCRYGLTRPIGIQITVFDAHDKTEVLREIILQQPKGRK